MVISKIKIGNNLYSIKDESALRAEDVTGNNNTATWGNAVIVGNVGGVDLKFTMPQKPNTDETDNNTTYKLNINGTVKGDSVNGVDLGTVYTATSVGTSGQYLKSTGNGAPVWSTIDLNGKANVTDLETLLDRVSVPVLSNAPTSNTLTYTSNGITKSFYIDQRCKIKDTTNGSAEQNYWVYYYLCDIVNGVAYWSIEKPSQSSEQPIEPVGGTKSYVLQANVPTAANLASILSTNPVKPTGVQTLEIPTLTKPTLLYLVYPLEWEVVQNNQLVKPVILDSNNWTQGVFYDENTPTLTVNGKTYRVLDVELGVDNYTIEF